MARFVWSDNLEDRFADDAPTGYLAGFPQKSLWLSPFSSVGAARGRGHARKRFLVDRAMLTGMSMLWRPFVAWRESWRSRDGRRRRLVWSALSGVGCVMGYAGSPGCMTARDGVTLGAAGYRRGVLSVFRHKNCLRLERLRDW